MKLARIALALAASALPFAGCECEEPLARLAPIIAIGDPFDANFSVCAIGLNADDPNKFRECAFDFGEVDVGRARVFSFTVRNPSPVKLKIKNIKIEDGCYEVYGTDGAGKKQEVFIDPKSFEIVGED